jgi:predicted ester cyclase
MSMVESIQRTVDALNSGDADAFAREFSDAAVLIDPVSPEPIVGREGVRRDVEGFFEAFPDLQAKLGRVLVSGQEAAFEIAFRGTHTGPLEGPGGAIPPTGKRIDMGVGIFSRCGDDGHFVESHRYYDQLALLTQLGLLPAPELPHP